MDRGLNLEWGKAVDALPYLLSGMVLTIIISVVGLILGFVVGMMMGLGRASKNKWIFGAATVYVEMIRGTPILVQALYLYYGVNQVLHQTIGLKFDPISAGIVTIAINAGAYIAEIVRGSIQSIEKGQTEAGRSLGLTHMQTFRYVIWPQAFKRMIPPLGNQFIISLKDTSLFSAIAVGELTRKGQETMATSFAAFEILTFVALLYLTMTLSISIVLRLIERRLDVS